MVDLTKFMYHYLYIIKYSPTLFGGLRMSNNNENKTKGRLILEELKDGEKSYKILKEKLHSTDLREPLATLLRNGKIRISGFDAYETKKVKNEEKREPRKRFAQDHLLFETKTENNKLTILMLFREMEGEDINKFDAAIKELLDKFKDKFKEYYRWETKVFETMKEYVIIISYTELIQEIERIIQNKLKLNDLSIDTNIKAYLQFYWDYSQSELTNLKNCIKKIRNEMESGSYTHYCFMKQIPENLPPGFPKDITSYKVTPCHKIIDKSKYLRQCDIKTLPGSFIWIEDIFYDLIIYMDSHDSYIMRNILIKCLSNPRTDDERLKNLNEFGKILKELGYIELSHREKEWKEYPELKHGPSRKIINQIQKKSEEINQICNLKPNDE